MKLPSFSLSLIAYVFFSTVVHSQSGVGINTTNPRTMLEIAGDLNVDGLVTVRNIKTTTSGDQGTFLIQTNTDFVKDIDAAGDGVAIAYFQEYRLRNMRGDWVDYLITGIPASDYMMTIISAYFNQELTMDPTASSNFTIPYTSAYVVDGIWRIRADYPSAAKKGTAEGVWIINTLILSKTFSKQLPVQTFTLSGTETERRGGAAANAVIN